MSDDRGPSGDTDAGATDAASATGRHVDLSQPVTDGMQTYPGDPAVECSPHATMPADGCRVTALSLGSHAGTHVDAPAHTEPDGATLGAFPPGRFVRETVVVDCRDLDASEAIPPSRLPQSVSPAAPTGAGAAAGEGGPATAADDRPGCVAFHTGWDRHWGTADYLGHPHLAPETARRCAAAGCDVAIDALSPDPTPVEPDVVEGSESGEAAASADGLAAHHALLGAGQLIVENLTGLDAVAPRFELRAYPLAFDGDGAPVRAVGVAGAAGDVDG